MVCETGNMSKKRLQELLEIDRRESIEEANKKISFLKEENNLMLIKLKILLFTIVLIFISYTYLNYKYNLLQKKYSNLSNIKSLEKKKIKRKKVDL